MTFRKNLKTLSEALAFAITLPLAACATLHRTGVIVTSCVSDPLTKSFHCVDRNGVDSEILWNDSANYVCRPPVEDQFLMEAANRK